MSDLPKWATVFKPPRDLLRNHMEYGPELTSIRYKDIVVFIYRYLSFTD